MLLHISSIQSHVLNDITNLLTIYSAIYLYLLQTYDLKTHENNNKIQYFWDTGIDFHILERLFKKCFFNFI